jgi:probable HAF family extracellular repeat protein
MKTVSKWITLLALLATSVGAYAQSYTVTELGTIGGTSAYAYGINSNGIVVGRSSAGGPADVLYATSWSGSSATNLGSLGGAGSYSAANGINDSGQIVGDSGITIAGQAIVEATLWNGTSPTDLGSLYGAGSLALSINDQGQAVGGSLLSSTFNEVATLWNGTAMTNLGTLPGFGSSEAISINNSGVAAGVSINFSTSAEQATLWNGAAATPLPGLGGLQSQASGINSLGTIVGSSEVTGSTNGNNAHAVLWKNGEIFDLGLGIAGSAGAQARAINNEGLVVGNSYLTLNGGTDYATLWEGSTAINLNSYLSPGMQSSITLNEATGINDSGWIAAMGTDSLTGQEEAFLLTPSPTVPLPASGWLLLTGLGAFAATRRRPAS